MNPVEQMIEVNLSPRLVADYFIARDDERADPDVTQMKLHKLMYFAQANYLAETGHRLFDSAIFAFEHGPVISSIYEEFRPFGRSTIAVKDGDIASLAKDRCRDLPPNTLRFLDAVWNKYGEFSASELRRMSHDDAPWLNAYDRASRYCPMDDEAIRDYYRSDAKRRDLVHCETVWFVHEQVWSELEALDAAF